MKNSTCLSGPECTVLWARTVYLFIYILFINKVTECLSAFTRESVYVSHQHFRVNFRSWSAQQTEWKKGEKAIQHSNIFIFPYIHVTEITNP
jgi:hypothetical protein